MKRTFIKAAIALFIASPMSIFAQQLTASAEKSYLLENALFNTLLIIALLLLALIAVLASVIKNLVSSDYLKYKKSKANASSSAKISGLIILFFLMNSLQSNAATINGKGWVGGLDPYTFYTLVVIIICELFIIAILAYIIHGFIKVEKPETVKLEQKEVVKKEKTIFDKLNASVEIEQETSIMFDHEYDGIKELDNNLPPWWKYGFYLTIVFAVFYLIHFHVSKTGDLQEAEYKKSVVKAEAEIAAYMKTQANNVDENSVKMLENPSDIEAGKTLFKASCAVCHGQNGEGTVGPNLTDEFWLHEGSLAGIFKSIKYGWQDKGMKSWKEELSPMQMAQVSSYIKTLKGTNPANAKAPQGEKYSESTNVTYADSAAVDSSNFPLIDTTKISSSVKKDKKE